VTEGEGKAAVPKSCRVQSEQSIAIGVVKLIAGVAAI